MVVVLVLEEEVLITPLSHKLKTASFLSEVALRGRQESQLRRTLKI
jgi:hypothetical protein